jgi:hypothetical protein
LGCDSMFELDSMIHKMKAWACGCSEMHYLDERSVKVRRNKHHETSYTKIENISILLCKCTKYFWYSYTNRSYAMQYAINANTNAAQRPFSAHK